MGPGKFLGMVLVLAGLSGSVQATQQSVTLAWSPSTNADVAGYHVYYGGASRAYKNMVAAGNVTNAAISGLLGGAEYFFAATTVDSAGVESLFSNEISYQVPDSGQLAVLAVTAANQSRTYGAPNPVLTGTVTGLQNADNITATFSTAATPASPVGTYSIVPALIDPDGKLTNYTVTINNGTLTVSPVPLTITAVSATSFCGAPLPPLTAAYSGFVNGDTASSLTTPPALTTTATAASPVGSYPITASGAASPNYTITYVNGTLSVIASAPALAVTFSGNQLVISTPSLSGWIYQLQSTASILSPSWVNAGTPLIGTGDVLQFTCDLSLGLPFQSFRIALSPAGP